MISSGNSPLWSEVLNSPADVQLAMFRQASAQPCADDVKTGFRAFAADLFARDLISMTEYVSIFGGTALHCLTPAESGLFRDMASGSDATALAGIYSRAKYGGVHDIRYLARQLIDYLSGELDRPDSQW